MITVRLDLTTCLAEEDGESNDFIIKDFKNYYKNKIYRIPKFFVYNNMEKIDKFSKFDTEKFIGIDENFSMILSSENSMLDKYYIHRYKKLTSHSGNNYEHILINDSIESVKIDDDVIKSRTAKSRTALLSFKECNIKILKKIEKLRYAIRSSARGIFI